MLPSPLLLRIGTNEKAVARSTARKSLSRDKKLSIFSFLFLLCAKAALMHKEEEEEEMSDTKVAHDDKNFVFTSRCSTCETSIIGPLMCPQKDGRKSFGLIFSLIILWVLDPQKY